MEAFMKLIEAQKKFIEQLYFTGIRSEWFLTLMDEKVLRGMFDYDNLIYDVGIYLKDLDQLHSVIVKATGIPWHKLL
jgi:hypothetical protein